MFSKFYRRYYDLISKFQVGLKFYLRQRLSEPGFYGDLVYKLKKIVDFNKFSALFIKMISNYKKDWLKRKCFATDCMLGGQPNHGLQLCFPL